MELWFVSERYSMSCIEPCKGVISIAPTVRSGLLIIKLFRAKDEERLKCNQFMARKIHPLIRGCGCLSQTIEYLMQCNTYGTLWLFSW